MARRTEETENHWPGFVDVLSTIVMVVTFLLIILGIVIFVISKNISAELAKAAQQVEAAQQALNVAKGQAEQAKEKVKIAALAQARAELQSTQNNQEQGDTKATKAEKNQQANAKSKKSAASFRSQFSEQLTQNDEIDSQDKRSVRSRQTKNTKQIVVSTAEQESQRQKVKVTSSQAVLSLLFKGGVKISDGASSEVQNYLKSNNVAGMSKKYEVRAFFNSDGGSISEARRLAYYRALATRNQLLKLGIKAKNIAIKVGNSRQPDDGSKVNIYLK